MCRPNFLPQTTYYFKRGKNRDIRSDYGRLGIPPTLAEWRPHHHLANRYLDSLASEQDRNDRANAVMSE